MNQLKIIKEYVSKHNYFLSVYKNNKYIKSYIGTNKEDCIKRFKELKLI